MAIFPYRIRRVAGNLRVRVSNHFCYTDFGVRDYGEVHHYGRRYVCSGTPGTGFIERDSESRSYHEFVRTHLSVRRSSYWNMLFRREPDYQRELKAATELMRTTDDLRKRELLECYANALTVGRQEEEMQRIVQAVKRKMGHRHNKYMVGVISHYKRKIEKLDDDMEAVEYHVRNHYSAEVYAAYNAMVEAFEHMTSRCRRVWHHNARRRDHLVQVFFDMGIFDFIRNESYLPLMRDSQGVSYYLLPDVLIVARSSVDFDLVPLKDLTIVCQNTSIVEATEMLSAHIDDVACMMLVPDLNLTFYFNHLRVVTDFVQALDNLKKLL